MPGLEQVGMPLAPWWSSSSWTVKKLQLSSGAGDVPRWADLEHGSKGGDWAGELVQQDVVGGPLLR